MNGWSTGISCPNIPKPPVLRNISPAGQSSRLISGRSPVQVRDVPSGAAKMTSALKVMKFYLDTGAGIWWKGERL